jgi:hypothetical protein
MAGDSDKFMTELFLADMADALNVDNDAEDQIDLSDDPLYAMMRKVCDRTGTIWVRDASGQATAHNCFIVERAANVFVLYGLPSEWLALISDEVDAEWDFDVSGPPYQVQKEPKYTFRPVYGDGVEPDRHIILGMEFARQADVFFTHGSNNKLIVMPTQSVESGDVFTDGDCG